MMLLSLFFGKHAKRPLLVRSMSLMRYLFILWVFLTVPAAAETSISGFVTGQSVPGKKSDTSVSTPNPANLKANWWRYFDVEPDILKERIDNIIRQLKAILEALPEDGKPDIKSRIDRISENMHTLLELRKKTVAELPASRPLQKAYSVRQWLDIVHKRRTAQAEVQSENEDLQRDTNRFNASQKRHDSLTAAYLELTEKSPDKMTQGLEVMAAWSELAVNGERLRLKNTALAMHQEQMKHLVEEAALASERLSASAEDLLHLKHEIEAAERDLSTAHENASQLAVTAMSGSMESDEDKARSLLIEQRIRHGGIEVAIFDAVVIRKQIELELAQRLNTTGDNTPHEGIRKRLQDNLETLAEMSGRIELWREQAERDQGRAGKSLAALFGTSGQQNSKLINLTQQRLADAQDTLLALQRLDGELHDAQLLAERLRGLIAPQEGALKSGLESVKTSSIKAGDLVLDFLHDSLFKLGETPVTILGLLRVLLIIMLAWSVSHFARRGLTHLSERRHGSSAFLYTLSRLVHYLILIIGISIGLSSIGVDLSNFALIAGALSLGIGFGLQAIVSNFVSGLIVLFEHSLRVGDFVELSSGVAGEVRAVNVRSTLVTTPDMVDILVPNSEFVNGKVINWTLTDASRRIHIPFGVAYGTDKEIVRKAVLEAAEKTPHTLKSRYGREPECWLTGFGDSNLNFELVVWVQPEAVKKPQRVRAAYYWELETSLRKHGIEIPFPQRDIHIRSGLL